MLFTIDCYTLPFVKYDVLVRKYKARVLKVVDDEMEKIGAELRRQGFQAKQELPLKAFAFEFLTSPDSCRDRVPLKEYTKYLLGMLEPHWSIGESLRGRQFFATRKTYVACEAYENVLIYAGTDQMEMMEFLMKEWR